MAGALEGSTDDLRSAQEVRANGEDPKSKQREHRTADGLPSATGVHERLETPSPVSGPSGFRMAQATSCLVRGRMLLAWSLLREEHDAALEREALAGEDPAQPAARPTRRARTAGGRLGGDAHLGVRARRPTDRMPGPAQKGPVLQLLAIVSQNNVRVLCLPTSGAGGAESNRRLYLSKVSG